MKKMNKNKRAFTLVEMMLVIAIIVILASATLFGVSRYITNSNKESSLAAKHSDVVDKAVSDIKSLVN